MSFFQWVLVYLSVCVLIAATLTLVLYREWKDKSKQDPKCPKNGPFWEYLKFSGAFVILPFATPIVNIFVVVFFGWQKASWLLGRKFHPGLMDRFSPQYVQGDNNGERVHLYPCSQCGCRAIDHYTQLEWYTKLSNGVRSMVTRNTIVCQFCHYKQYHDGNTASAACEWNLTYLDTRTGLDWWRIYFAKSYSGRLFEAPSNPPFRINTHL